MAKRPIVKREDLGRGPIAKKTWKASEGTSPMIGARIDKELRADFEAIAKREGVYLSDLLRWLIRRFVADYDAGRVELPKRPREPDAPYTLE